MTRAEHERQQRINAYQRALHLEYLQDRVEAAWRWQRAVEALGAGEQYTRVAEVCKLLDNED